MNAKRMLNISGILNTLFYTPLYLFAVCFCQSVCTDDIRQLGGRLHALTPAWKGKEEISVHMCMPVG